VAFKGTTAELHDLISAGGQHLSMPAWKGTLSDTDVENLAGYVTQPKTHPAGEVLFGQHCAVCHGDRVPSAPDMNTARKIINGGGAHVTMPVWGQILTPEQLDALVQYTSAASGAGGGQAGAQLYAANCSACHGNLGQGGPNPGRVGDMIPPISSAEFLGTRDDSTLRNIISQGQPDLGMNPFGSAFGGSLNDEEVDSLVAYVRGWQANPPKIEIPTPAAVAPVPAIPLGAQATFSASVQPIFLARCQACHNTSTHLGGWDASSYDTVFKTGENAPVVIAGDVENSALARLVQGLDGKTMPPAGGLPQSEIQVILDWISSGAANN
jgi:mono/diheme cytochrome c family protein